MATTAHITPVIHSRGGMQSHLRAHLALDRASGHEPRLVALFETMPAGGADVGLGAAWWWTPRRLRRVFQNRARALTTGALVMYHNAWGLPLLAPGDGAARRLAYLHTDWPGLEPAVRASARWCDGIICVSGALAEKVRRIVPDYPAARVHRIHYPISPPDGLAGGGNAAAGRPLRVGYAGRLESPQKRVERLPALMRACMAGGVPVEWHVLGDGPERARLAEAARAAGGAQFHGWLGGADYWRAIAALDVIVFFSDYEGTPIALLEAMSAGVTPLFPAIGGDGEELAHAVAPECVYPPGALDVAARQLRALAAGDAAARRARARALVANHTPANYAAELARATQAVWAQPRHAADESFRTARWSDALPMGVVSRWYEKAIWC